jgi:hypothetical protein
MGSYATKAGKFALALGCCLILSSLLWQQVVTGVLYDCTDSSGIDFLNPGDWVHHAVAVANITSGRPMGEPDQIKQGWTSERLLILWFAFVSASAVFGAGATLAPWCWNENAVQIREEAETVTR